MYDAGSPTRQLRAVGATGAIQQGPVGTHTREANCVMPHGAIAWDSVT
jgi:hypothetical protein